MKSLKWKVKSESVIISDENFQKLSFDVRAEIFEWLDFAGL